MEDSVSSSSGTLRLQGRCGDAIDRFDNNNIANGDVDWSRQSAWRQGAGVEHCRRKAWPGFTEENEAFLRPPVGEKASLVTQKCVTPSNTIPTKMRRISKSNSFTDY